MVRTERDGLRERARRAYELGRLKRGAARAWPVVLLAAVSSFMCHEPFVSIGIGTGLFAVVAACYWHSRVVAQAANAGLKIGVAAFAVLVASFSFYYAPYCSTLTALLVINGGCGLGAGVLLSIESARMKTGGNLFLLLASVVAAACGMLACILFGPVGTIGMAAGVALTTAPVAIYRRATV